jgi:hypothetical protein
MRRTPYEEIVGELLAEILGSLLRGESHRLLALACLCLNVAAVVVPFTVAA